ncbi:MAG: c-type cytochrome [Methyloligellaceae bacterium]
MAGRKLTSYGLAVAIMLVAAPDNAGAGGAEDDYRLYCVQCHGTTGNGWGINNMAGGLVVSPRNHTNAGEMSKLSDEELRLAIADGGDAVSKSELMPPWEGVLTEKQIAELVVYLRKLCKCSGPG